MTTLSRHLSEPALLPAIRLRQLRPDDAPRLHRLLGRLSPQTRYRRFFTEHVPAIEALCPQLLDVDGCNRLALVAALGDEVIGVARYHRPPGAREAEVAVVVDDAWQGRGLGRRLLARLAELAARRQVDVFTGTILGENRRIIRVLRQVFGDVRFTLDSGTYLMRADVASRATSPAPMPAGADAVSS